MSALQEQAVRMVRGLSDENTSFLIEIMKRLMPQKNNAEARPNDGACMQAFSRLDAARGEILQYLPEDFDPDKELEEARAQRYGGID